MRILTLAFTFLLLPLAAAAAEQAGPAVEDTSYRDANGNWVQQIRVVVDAPVAKVWAAFATSEGFKTWAAPVAHIDLRNDGMIEASYSLTAKIGDPDNIRNRIVAYVPERVIVLQNVHAPQSARAAFDPATFKTIRSVIEFQDLGNGKTRVIQSGVGYGSGEAYEKVFKHFRAGNVFAFRLLAQSFATGPIDWAAMMAQAQAAVKPAQSSQSGQ
jgi:uncharacterized protein YndB with AHSA1/START domain